ncbi:MAG: hypothetical protein AAF664_25660, partial [Planctomycetota bacterium]
RVAKHVVASVPLEHIIRIAKARRAAKASRHLNFYIKRLIENILEPSGLKVLDTKCYVTAREYEKFVSLGLGSLKYAVRSTALGTFPRVTLGLINTMAIALCEKS